jgi:hypothetical protein
MRVITFLSLLLGAQAWAQPSFLVKHALPPNTLIRSSDLATDGGLVLAGGIDDDLIYIDRLDAAGNSIWSKAMDVSQIYGPTFTDHRPAYPNHVACLANGNIVLAGQAGETNFELNQVAARHFVLLSDDGDVILDRAEYYSFREQYWRGVLPLSNGTILLSGSDQSLSLSYGYLYVYDPGSDMIVTAEQTRRLGSEEFYTADGFGRVIASSSGGYIGVGSDYVVRLSADLEPLWHMYFDALGLVDVGEAEDGSVFLAWPDKLMRLTASGALEWSVSAPAELGTIVAIQARADGSLNVAGTGIDGAIWWGEVDPQGGLAWQEQWEQPGIPFTLQGMHRHPDGRLSLVAQNNGSEPTVAVLTTDLNGRVEGCSQPGPTPSMEIVSITVLPYDLGTYELTEFDQTYGSFIQETPIYTLTTEQCESGFGRLSGTVYHDVNANGSQDPEDAAVAWQPVLVTPDGSYAYSTIQGYEVDLLTPGTRTISLVHNEAIWGLSAGASGHVVEITDVDTTITGIDFGLFALLDTAIVQGALTSAPTRCSMLIPQTINVLNQGTTTPDVLVALTMDPLITFVSSVPAPDSIAGDTIYWHLDDLPLFEQASITLQMLMPDFNAIGSELQATVRCYEVLDGGGLTGLTESIWSSTLICSYDPNDKLVEPTGMGPVGAIPPETEWLTYTVRFQNTGNDTAFAVVIRDQLSTRLDRSSLEVLGTSHELTDLTVTSGGLAAFEFDNILLPDSGTNELASHGFVRFRLRLQENLPHGTEIRNDAGIYFDLNPPVITNTVLNTIQNCALDTFQLELRYENGELLVWSPTGIFLWEYFNMEWYRNGEPVEMNQNGNCTPELPGFYTVVLSTYYTGCVLELGPYQVISTAVRDIEMPLLRVLPNPFTDQLLVQCGRPHDHIELIDVNGHVVLSRSTGNTTSVYVDRDDLASGIYLLRMMQGTTVVATARVVAQ